MTVNYGHDTSCTDDLYPGRVVSGAALLAEAAYRRITTPRGRLLDDPSYGLDVRAFMHRGMTPKEIARIPGIIEAEVAKDERVAAVSCAASFVDGRLRLSIGGRGARGPFALVVATDGVTVELLRGAT